MIVNSAYYANLYSKDCNMTCRLIKSKLLHFVTTLGSETTTLLTHFGIKDYSSFELSCTGDIEATSEWVTCDGEKVKPLNLEPLDPPTDDVVRRYVDVELLRDGTLLHKSKLQMTEVRDLYSRFESMTVVMKVGVVVLLDLKEGNKPEAQTIIARDIHPTSACHNNELVCVVDRNLNLIAADRGEQVWKTFDVTEYGVVHEFGTIPTDGTIGSRSDSIYVVFRNNGTYELRQVEICDSVIYLSHVIATGVMSVSTLTRPRLD